VPEQSFEDRLDIVCASEHALEPRPSASESKYDQIPGIGRPGALPVDNDGRATLEERVADEELAATGELGDDECFGRGRYCPPGARKASQARTQGVFVLNLSPQATEDAVWRSFAAAQEPVEAAGRGIYST
jgi:hypothetical protein